MLVRVGEYDINPQLVVSVKRESYDRFLIVQTSLGEQFQIYPNYGETIYDAHDRVRNLLSEAG